MLKTGTANVTVSAITDFSVSALRSLKNENFANAKVTPVPKAISPPLAVPTSTSEISSAETSSSNKLPQVEPQAVTNSTIAVANKNNAEYIQVFASKSAAQAQNLANALATLHQKETQLEKINGIFRVLVGPIKQREELASLLLAIKNNGYPNAFVRRTSE